MHTSIRCPLKYLCKIICKKNMDQWGGNLTVICIYDLSFWLNPKISFKFSKLRATHFLKLQLENLVSQVCMKMYWNCRKKSTKITSLGWGVDAWVKTLSKILNMHLESIISPPSIFCESLLTKNVVTNDVY